MDSTIRANHPPEVPTIALFHVKLAPRADIETDISSSACRYGTLPSFITSTKILDAGVIG